MTIMQWVIAAAVLLYAFFYPERLFWRRFWWYRCFLGGRWTRVSGLFFNRKWVAVHPECVERVDEDWGPRRWIDFWDKD